jgi:hypothetical protein
MQSTISVAQRAAFVVFLLRRFVFQQTKVENRPANRIGSQLLQLRSPFVTQHLKISHARHVVRTASILSEIFALPRFNVHELRSAHRSDSLPDSAPIRSGIE